MSDPELNFSQLDKLVMEAEARVRQAGDEERADRVAASMAYVREALRNPGDLVEALQMITDNTEEILRAVLEHSGQLAPGDPVR